MGRNMDESRKLFEQAYGQLRKDGKTINLWDVWSMAWQASRAAIEKGSIVGYQDPYGNAVSAGDFDGGEDEMHETAYQEGWTPLVRAAGIKVKE